MYTGCWGPVDLQRYAKSTGLERDRQTDLENIQW